MTDAVSAAFPGASRRRCAATAGFSVVSYADDVFRRVFAGRSNGACSIRRISGGFRCEWWFSTAFRAELARLPALVRALVRRGRARGGGLGAAAAALLLVVLVVLVVSGGGGGGGSGGASGGAISDPHFSASVKTCYPELFHLVKKRSGNYVKQTKNFSAALAAVSLRNREFFVERPT